MRDAFGRKLAVGDVIAFAGPYGICAGRICAVHTKSIEYQMECGGKVHRVFSSRRLLLVREDFLCRWILTLYGNNWSQTED